MPAAAGRWLLLVEDDSEDADLAIASLREGRFSCEVVRARDGPEALAMLNLEPGADGRPDRGAPALVLLDLKLPRLDGLEVLARLRAESRTRTLPVVILTSSLMDRDLARAYALGANGFVRKPSGFPEFAEALRGIGLFWLSLNEPPPPAAPPRG